MYTYNYLHLFFGHVMNVLSQNISSRFGCSLGPQWTPMDWEFLVHYSPPGPTDTISQIEDYLNIMWFLSSFPGMSTFWEHFCWPDWPLLSIDFSVHLIETNAYIPDTKLRARIMECCLPGSGSAAKQGTQPIWRGTSGRCRGEGGWWCDRFFGGWRCWSKKKNGLELNSGVQKLCFVLVSITVMKQDHQLYKAVGLQISQCWIWVNEDVTSCTPTSRWLYTGVIRGNLLARNWEMI